VHRRVVQAFDLSLLLPGRGNVTERAALLLDVVMDMIDGSLNTMSEDKFYTPPTWILVKLVEYVVHRAT